MTKTVQHTDFLLIGVSLLLLFAASLTGAEEATCTDDSLPPAMLGNDKAQIETLLKQGTDCAREGKLEKAITLFSDVIRRAPTNSVAYLNRGSAEIGLGEIEQALGDYTTAISLQPDLAEAWYDRGTTFAHMRRFERAIGDFTETIRLKPDFSLALCNRAFANFELNRYDDALADYTLAIGQASSLTYCYFGRCNLFLTIGEYQKAVDDFTEALSHQARDALVSAERRPTKLSASVTTLSMIFAPRWMQIRTSKVRERASPASPRNKNSQIAKVSNRSRAANPS